MTVLAQGKGAAAGAEAGTAHARGTGGSTGRPGLPRRLRQPSGGPQGPPATLRLGRDGSLGGSSGELPAPDPRVREPGGEREEDGGAGNDGRDRAGRARGGGRRAGSPRTEAAAAAGSAAAPEARAGLRLTGPGPPPAPSAQRRARSGGASRRRYPPFPAGPRRVPPTPPARPPSPHAARQRRSGALRATAHTPPPTPAPHSHRREGWAAGGGTAAPELPEAAETKGAKQQSGGSGSRAGVDASNHERLGLRLLRCCQRAAGCCCSEDYTVKGAEERLAGLAVQR